MENLLKIFEIVLTLILLNIQILQKILKIQSKLSFDGVSACYDAFNIYAYKYSSITFNKNNYLGYSILELSKLLMYQFYYDKFQPFRKDNLKLHYIDTDAFVLSIKTGDVIKDLEHFKDDFDFSDLDPNHQLYSPTNKKVIGKFKVETLPYLEIDEFCCLRSKSYSYSYANKEISKQKRYTNSIYFK